MCHLLDELSGWQSMISDPRQCFNADESGFPLCPNYGKVLAPKGSKQVQQIGAGKSQVTVMVGFSGMGMYLSSLIIFPELPFHTYCVQPNIPFPVILYIDGHASHISLKTSVFCWGKSTIL